MKCFMRLASLSVVAASLFLVGGCADNNEQTANITGVAPTGGGGTQADYANQSRGDTRADMKAQGYPGAQ